MALKSPIVSLAMPVFNGANYIHEAIQSIQSQCFADFELIVTDNDSTDGTRDIVTGFAATDPRIRLVRNGRNIGAAANYNFGFSLSSGKYLKWCAHDDRISPNFLERCLGVLEAEPDTALAFASTTQISSRDQLLPTRMETPSIDADDPAERFWQAIDLAGTCFPIFGLFRRSLLARSTLHWPYYGSDRALLAEMAIMGKFRLVEDAVFYNREHEQRSINIADKVQRSFWQTGRQSRSTAAEHINLTLHLFKIASRHRDIVAPAQLRLGLLRRSMSPRQLGRYGLEMLSMVSPAAASACKSWFASPIPFTEQKQGMLNNA